MNYRSLCKIHFDHVFLLQYISKWLKITRLHREIGREPYEVFFGGKLRAGHASMNLGKFEDGVLAEEQLLEDLGDKNKEDSFLTAEKSAARTWQSAWERPRGFTVWSLWIAVTLVEGVRIEWDPFCGMGSLVREVSIYNNKRQCWTKMNKQKHRWKCRFFLTLCENCFYETLNKLASLDISWKILISK